MRAGRRYTNDIDRSIFIVSTAAVAASTDFSAALILF
jgi:hypothetical protein